MSMSRSVMEELCEFVLHKPSTLLGNKFFDCRAAISVDVSLKADKYEPKLLVISKFRLFFVTGKSPSSLKIERSFHVLSIRAIQVIKDDEIAVTLEDTSQTKKRYIIRSSQQSAAQVTIHLLSALKHYFPDIGGQLESQVELVPISLYDDFAAYPLDAAARPCHSFRRTYAAMCDFYDQPYREEVSWDVEKIYTINKVRSLRIDDFSHLLPKDLLPIVGVLQYSSYFNGLVADGVRLPPELIDVILTVIKKSHQLKELQLRNCALPRDFISLFASAVQHTAAVPLELLDLSKNILDDKKGFASLCVVLPRMTSLRSIIMSECGLSDKCIHSLCSGLYNGLTSSKAGCSHGLRQLSLAYSSIKDEVSSLVNLVSLCTSLRELDLTDTGFPLDKLWPALKYGGLQLERLMLGGCHVGKKPAECAQTVKEFFTMAVSLQHISLANTQLSPELLKAMLLGLCSNQQLKPYYLDLDAVCDKSCGAVLEACLSGLRCSGISLRDNNLETDMQGVVSALCCIPSLRRVDIGGSNLSALRRSSKPAHASILNRILLDIVKLYSDGSPVEELVLSKAQLGSHLSVLLNTLGATPSLRYLDISHNDMGNFGARILSKALQLNVSLRAISIDNNKIGVDGFVDLANAMQLNYTLTSLPYPVNDVFECRARNEHPRAISALSQVESALERNRSADSVEQANGKRALNGGRLQSHLDNGSGSVNTSMVEEVIADAKREVLPSRIEEMVNDFVEQLRREASLTIHESIARLGGGGGGAGGDGSSPASVSSLDCSVDIARAERIASDRLRELWMRDVKVVVSDWRWRELVERSEAILRSDQGGGGGGGRTSGGSVGSASVEGSPSISSPRIHKRSTDASHRPRSIIGELAQSQQSSPQHQLHFNQSQPSSPRPAPIQEEAPAGEGAISLDTPPKPSALVHLQKARPRRRGQSTNTAGGGDANADIVVMTRSLELVDMDEETRSLHSEDSAASETKKPLSERAGFRPAMLPEASLLSSVQLRPTTDRVSSPRDRDPPSPFLPAAPTESPPPLPSRTRGTTPHPLSPPSLPPKPEPRLRPSLGNTNVLATSTSTSTNDDEENANSRRSVAEMTRMFGR